MLALIEMELVGHPFSLKRMEENIEWYDTRLEKLLAQTVEYIKTRAESRRNQSRLRRPAAAHSVQPGAGRHRPVPAVLDREARARVAPGGQGGALQGHQAGNSARRPEAIERGQGKSQADSWITSTRATAAPRLI